MHTWESPQHSSTKRGRGGVHSSFHLSLHSSKQLEGENRASTTVLFAALRAVTDLGLHCSLISGVARQHRRPHQRIMILLC